MSRQPFQFYVDAYNMVSKSRRKAAYRFSKSSWESLMMYRQYEIDDAVKTALAQPKLELIKSLRLDHSLLYCRRCIESGMFGGSAMTSWTCSGCKRPQISGSTCTGVLCEYCAFAKFACKNCGESLDKELEHHA